MPGLNMPNVLKDANVYIDGSDFLGKAEMKLPKVTHVSVEHQAMNISGKVEFPLPGIVEKLEGSIKFKSYNEKALKHLYDSSKAQQIDVYASVQRYNSQTGVMEEFPVKAVIKAFFKEVDHPELKQAQEEAAEISYSAVYYKLVVDGQDVVEVDPLNYIYKVAGQDILQTTKTNLGIK